MELKEYLELLKKHKILFFSAWLFFFLLPAGLAFWQSRHYESVFSLSIGFSGEEKTTDYQYDQYYRLLAAEKFSDGLLWWLKDPETVRFVLEKSGISNLNSNWQNLEKIFQGKRLSSNYSQVYFQNFSPRQAEKITENWRDVLNKKTVELNGESSSKFFLTVGQPLTSFPANNYRLLFLLGFLVGLPLAVFVVLFVDYFKETDAYRN